MDHNKKNGIYYTPEVLADFMTNYVLQSLDLKEPLNILEPSCGDGVFIKSLFKHEFLNKYSYNLEIVEKNNREINKAKKIYIELTNSNNEIEDSITCYNMDYLIFHKQNNKRYDLIIGNPPYIKRKYLSQKQIQLCEEILKKNNFDNKIMNIWIAFILSVNMFLKDKGVLFFVLPAEILQVNYAKKVRKILNKSFDRIEIFAFNELVFPNIEQDVILFLGVKRSKTKGIVFHLIDNLSDLKEVRQISEKDYHSKSDDKWTKYILSKDDLHLLDKLKINLKLVKEYCQSQVGIVTGANDFFIINKDEVEKYNLEKYAMAILKKSSFFPKGVKFTKNDFSKIFNKNKRCNLLFFDKEEFKAFDNEAKLYLKKGVEEEIDRKYKCKKRTLWYKVPSVWKSEAMFFKRSHLYPKLVLNQAEVLVTDTAYRIRMHEPYDIKSFIFCFYNSLTLAFTELIGRYYGGGVLELTPNEFKRLPIPYFEFSEDKFLKLDKMFREGYDLDQILDYTDTIILSKKLGIDELTLKKIKSLRKKLSFRRRKI